MVHSTLPRHALVRSLLFQVLQYSCRLPPIPEYTPLFRPHPLLEGSGCIGTRGEPFTLTKFWLQFWVVTSPAAKIKNFIRLSTEFARRTTTRNYTPLELFFISTS